MSERDPQDVRRASIASALPCALALALVAAGCGNREPAAPPSPTPVAAATPEATPAPTPIPEPSLPPGGRPLKESAADTLSAWDIDQNPLKPRQEAQLKTADKLKVFHDFRFTDRVKESGITFASHVVDDASRDYKLNHYDHGFGVLAADVDGDGLVDLYFLSQLGDNELWKNLGNGKFKNITAESGLALKDQISVSGAFADIDNDGDEDLYVTTVRHGNHLFENDGKGHFKDITKEAGLEYSGHSSGAVFFDFDHDGLLDLYLVNTGVFTKNEVAPDGHYVGFDYAVIGHIHPERREDSILYRNLGHNHFANVSKEMGMAVDEGWAGDATIADFNQDGWPDLYVTNMQGDDHYFENEGGKRFVDKTKTYFPKTPWGAMGVKVFDFNNDGLLDLFITDMHSDMTMDVGPEKEKLKSVMVVDKAILGPCRGEDNIFGNALWKNLGGGKFEEVSDAMGVETYWPWGTSVGDLNADGWDDIFITASMNYPWRYGVNSLLLNNAGESFVDSEFILGVEPRRDGRTEKVWFELDCSGADRDHSACLGRKGHVKVLGTLGSRSSVLFDLDGDGDLDIVTNDLNSEPMVLVSNLAQKRKIDFLEVKLHGTTSNRDGLGALVKVTAGGKSYVKYADGKTGYISHGIIPLYFGLGEAAKAEQVEVMWPSGKKQVVASGIPANGILTVTEE